MSEYRRLPGKQYRVFGNATVWEGADHFLSVQNHRFSEEYRRFYYRDVQAVILRDRGKWPVAVSVAAGVLLLLLVAALLTQRWLAVFIAPVLIGMGIDLALGSRCACYVRTATGTWRLPAVSRMRSGRRFLERVKPLIEAAQGGAGPLAPGAIHLAVSAGAIAGSPIEESRAAHPVNLRALYATFGAAIVASALSSASNATQNILVYAAAILGGVAVLGMTILALVKWGRGAGSDVRVILFGLGGLGVFKVVLFFVSSVWMEVLAAEKKIAATANLLPKELLWLDYGSDALVTLVALAGLMLLVRLPDKAAG